VDLVTDNGCWNWETLSWIPCNILNKLIALLTPEDINDDDSNYWPYSKHACYSVVSAYNMLSELDQSEEDVMWKKIWKLQVPERVRSFIWLLKHGRLLTNYRKSKMGMGSSFCAFCGDVEETELHVLSDCPRCMNVWLNIIHGNKREVFFNSTLQQWININMNGTIEGIEVNKWDSYWPSACHSLWYWRYKESHDDNYNQPIDSKHYILKQVKDYIMQSRVCCRFIMLRRDKRYGLRFGKLAELLLIQTVLGGIITCAAVEV
jgi:hypothetical protein